MKFQFVPLAMLLTTLMNTMSIDSANSQSSFSNQTAQTKISQKLKSDHSKIEFKDLPVIGGQDWRSGKFDGPWSKLVLVKDDFDGDYVAVMDRNYSSNLSGRMEIGVVTNWSAKKLRMYLYQSFQACPFCGKSMYEIPATRKVSVKVGDKIFNLTSEDSQFDISEEMAVALKNSPPGSAKIKMDIGAAGQNEVSDIGPQTIEAWKMIYKDAGSVSQLKPNGSKKAK